MSSKVGERAALLNEITVGFRCPGCKGNRHCIVIAPAENAWGWNGDLDRPTFTPSVLTWDRTWVLADPTQPPVYEPHPTLPGVKQDTRPGHFEERNRCHSFVTDGRIQFLGDCSHELAGQTVDLLPWDD